MRRWLLLGETDEQGVWTETLDGEDTSLERLAHFTSADDEPTDEELAEHLEGRDGDTSEEEMRDWNAHIEESWLAEPDVSIPASRLPSMDDYPDAVPGGPVTHPASEPTRRELWDRKESTP